MFHGIILFFLIINGVYLLKISFIVYQGEIYIYLKHKKKHNTLKFGNATMKLFNNCNSKWGELLEWLALNREHLLRQHLE